MENKKATQEEIQLKMLLIGEQAVGKSSLINQYVEGKFELNLLCAAGLDLKKKMKLARCRNSPQLNKS